MERHLFSIKIYEITRKLKVKYRVGLGSLGVGRDLLSQKGGMHLITLIQIIIYTQYVIAYCFIMY